MAIALFITFLFTNLLMIFVMKFVFAGNYSYNEGMLLGVHIPEEHAKDESVQSIVSTARHKMNRALLVNLILGIVVCFAAFWSVAIFLFIYFFWITIFIFWVLSSNIMSHRKMYALKTANNWIDESQKRKIYIDTNVSAELGKEEISLKYHGYILLAEVICVMPFVIKHEEPIFTTLIIMGVCSITISLFAMFFHMYMNSHESAVYSADTAINQKVCQTMKKYKGAAMLLMSGINAVSWLYISIDTLIRGFVRARNLSGGSSLRITFAELSMSESAFYVYLFIQMLGVIGMLVPLLIAQSRKKEILTENTQPLYVDDDEYWKSGFYYNPDDPKVLVPNRMQSGSYAFNYATRGARFWTVFLYIFIIGCIAWTIGALAPFINVHIDTIIDDDRLTVSAAGYSSEIYLDDIETVKLLNTLPDDHFVKTNGGDTEEYMVGHFKSRTYGKCELYLYTNNSPIIMIQTRTDTVFVNSENSEQTKTLYKSLHTH